MWKRWLRVCANALLGRSPLTLHHAERLRLVRGGNESWCDFERRVAAAQTELADASLAFIQEAQAEGTYELTGTRCVTYWRPPFSEAYQRLLRARGEPNHEGEQPYR